MLKLKLLIILLFFSLSSTLSANELHDALLKKASSGSAEANYHLGMLYNNGIGVNKSPLKAFRLFLKAAEHGDALGHYKVGCYYAGQFGNIEGVGLNKTKTFEHKLIAAKAGYSLAQSDIAAIYYRNGDLTQAITWAHKAAEQGHVQSLSNLLSLYQMPQSPSKSNQKAYLALLKAEKLIPKNEQLISLKKQIANKLSSIEIEKIVKQVTEWAPKRTELTDNAMQGIKRASAVAGLTSIE
ncbi:tetratricopeptide repeat protein [Thalassotalea sp. PP2-459]|uniref:tetratricopeptide repeat protein n=1 Tax=Thalassotalea sp. PP2-459 TaxID=1742724 RepID=UPI00094245F9|nr:tetratricopeptide repeat protein [Thalassotalea sp. PP2-459]OKY25176.1 hypothetical protein BI291_03980 [Thalassotalea sp. PP2-459]